MKKRQQPARQPACPQSGGSEYFHLVAAAERCVRVALECERLPLLNPEPIMDGLNRTSDRRDEFDG
jgi:hypothetical protein